MTQLNTSFKTLCCLLLLMGLSVPGFCLAQDDDTEQASDQQAQEAPEAEDDGYARWLETYGAWDQLDQTYVQQEETPELIIKRAEIHIQLGEPDQALSLLEQNGPFATNATESDRLWLGGRSQRALGDPARAMTWYAEAAKFMDESQTRSRFRNEPGLDTIWKDVWRKMFWNWATNPSSSRESLQPFLEQTLEIAGSVWGSEDFWQHVRLTFDTMTAPVAPAPDPTQIAEPPFINDENKARIARALASLALEDLDAANATIAEVDPLIVRQFWYDVARYAVLDETPADVDFYATQGFGKARAFWSSGILENLPQGRHQWFLGNPRSAAWNRFRDNLLGMDDPQDTMAAIDKEMGSLLITEETVFLLQSFKLAFALVQENDSMARTIWYALDKRALPLSLQLAGMILFDGKLPDLLPENTAQAAQLAPVLATLASAADVDPETPYNAPFWATLTGTRLVRAINGVWPLDRLLILAAWDDVFTSRPAAAVARRAAYLFPTTDLGVRSILFLARDAVENRQHDLAKQYLALLDPAAIAPDYQAERLQILAEMELGEGRQAEALANYRQLLRTGAEIDPMTRLQMALLLQQTGDLRGGREHLLILWEGREDLDKAMHAEILYWLGEGEQAMGNMDQALDYYLRLAYEYPEQNIWAITAMYRASMIYELRGQFDTAKRLLKTVISRADTQEQREAARARLNAIEGRIAQPAPDGMVYPF